MRSVLKHIGLVATLGLALVVLMWIAQPVVEHGNGTALAQSQASDEEVQLIQSLDGQTLYRTYCAVCHGMDGKGGGPAAAALKKVPPDLTRISERNRGVFPEARVQQIIAGEEVPTPAHGSREMPVWGPIFGQIAWDQDLGKVRVYNLAKYLESLQRN